MARCRRHDGSTFEYHGSISPESKESSDSYSYDVGSEIVSDNRFKPQHIAREGKAEHAEDQGDSVDDKEERDLSSSAGTLAVFPSPMAIAEVGHKDRDDSRDDRCRQRLTG